jgi:hypothetical protein
MNFFYATIGPQIPPKIPNARSSQQKFRSTETNQAGADNNLTVANTTIFRQ